MSGSSSEDDIREEGDRHDTPLTYTQQFKEAFPYYLSIGMSYEEFWYGDVMLTKDYQKAQELRDERKNQELWIQGMYIYEALCAVSAVIPRLSKRPVKPGPYAERPYPLKAEKKRNAEEIAKREMEKMKRKMDIFATKTNAKFARKKGGDKNGGRTDH